MREDEGAMIYCRRGGRGRRKNMLGGVWQDLRLSLPLLVVIGDGCCPEGPAIRVGGGPVWVGLWSVCWCWESERERW